MYDPQVFEGLLAGGRSSGMRGGVCTAGTAWRECNGIFYELGEDASGLNVFIANSGWYGSIGCPELL